MLKKSISRKKCWDANLVATGHPTVILRTLRFFGLNQKGKKFNVKVTFKREGLLHKTKMAPVFIIFDYLFNIF